jgi:hypothetical protein
MKHGWAPLFSMRSDRFKDIDAPQPELFDLHRDPFEQRNLLDQRQRLAAAMQARLRTLVQRELTTRQSQPLDSELHVRLASLGYLAGRVPDMWTGVTNLPDPKDCSGVFGLGRCAPLTTGH